MNKETILTLLFFAAIGLMTFSSNLYATLAGILIALFITWVAAR